MRYLAVGGASCGRRGGIKIVYEAGGEAVTRDIK